MEWAINILYWVASHKILYFVVSFIPLFWGIMVLGAEKKVKGKISRRTALFGSLGIFLFSYGIINLIRGSTISAYFVYKYGEKGTGVITSTRGTNIRYNERYVEAYEVLIKTKEGKQVESEFTSMDFNIYPVPEHGYSYPSPGVRFSVYYLKSNPHAFVIVGNDDSSYAMSVRCTDALRELGSAKIKFDADSGNAVYRKKYVRALKNYIQWKCAGSEYMQGFYANEIKRLEVAN